MSVTPSTLRLQLRLPALLPAAPLPVPALLGGVALFLLLRPLFGLLHELLVLGLARLLPLVAGAPLWPALISHLPLDPVYTLAMIQFAGQVEVVGIALVDPLGSRFHAAFPAFIAPPALVTTGWVSTVLEGGSTVLARGLVGFGADTLMLAVGVGLLALGLRGRPALLVTGGLQQGHVMLYHFFDQRFSVRDLEAAGLPFALSALLSDASQRAPWFTRELHQIPAPLLSLSAGLLLVTLAYLLILTPALIPSLIRRVGQSAAPPPLAPSASLGWALPTQLGVCAVIIGLALTPLGAFAEGDTRLLDSETSAPEPLEVPVAASAETSRAASVQLPRTPAEVQFVGQQYRFTVLVNGQRTVIRGMGYNAEYADRDPAERARLYDRDFSLMHQAGVNVIFGWFQDQFDSLTLDKAHQHGLGVALPYELNQDWDYDDPAVRARITGDVLATVRQYREHPALWFWTPGNEVIHRLIFPSWLKHERDLVRERRADSFARFYVELIDQLHQADPRHPIIYRDAEEVYLQRIRDQLLAGGVQRPWFAYGTNVYSGRLEEILASWPRQGLDVPLFVSEYSPGGTGPTNRPQGLRTMWSSIRTYSDWVIGGAVYTWTTDGPEELDRVFGLVDETGQPRDGSLATIAELYRGQTPAQ